LRITNEDSLYDFIFWRIEQDSDSVFLLEYVQFEFLSLATITRFCADSHEFLDRFTPTIWDRICTRLAHEIFPKSENPRLPRPANVVLPPDPSSVLDGGIVSYLRDNYGDGFGSPPVLQVTASSVVSDSPSYSPMNITWLRGDPFFHYRNDRNQWVQYKFRKWRVTLTHYTIRSYFTSQRGQYNLRSWVIEGSIDGEAWTEIDRRVDNSDLDGAGVSHLFEVSNNTGIYRFIRLRQTGKNHHDDDFLIISDFEIFGTLFKTSK
jgi:hypothetical protein